MNEQRLRAIVNSSRDYTEAVNRLKGELSGVDEAIKSNWLNKLGNTWGTLKGWGSSSPISSGGVGGGGLGGFSLNIGDRFISMVTQNIKSLMGQQAELETSSIPDLNIRNLASMSLLKGIAIDNEKIESAAFLASNLDLVIDQLRQESELRSEINQKTQLSGQLSQYLRDDMARSAVYATKYGFTMRDLGNLYIELVNQSGKFSLINEKTMNMAVAPARTLGMTMSELGIYMAEFEKAGIGANQSLRTIDEVTVKSLELGLSGKKVLSDMQQNIGKLNEFGFQNGIRGLERMAQRANEFRLSMDSVFNIAKDVMDPEKALSLSANLQVLGGAIGDFNDPLKLMYMATNNVEGLQNALIDAAGSLATYNEEQGRFVITPLNMRRAKEMADQLGMTYGDLTKSAIAAAERTQALSSIRASGLKIDEKQIEFLTNLARMEDGEMKISIPKSLSEELEGEFKGQTEVALSKMDERTANAIIKFQQAYATMDTKKMAMDQLDQLQLISRNMNVVAAYYKYTTVKTIGKDLVDSVTGFIQTSLGSFTPAQLQQSALENLKSVIVEPVKASNVGTNNMYNQTNTQNNTSTTTTKNINITTKFSSDPDSDRIRRAYEEEMRKNSRDFTDFYSKEN